MNRTIPQFALLSVPASELTTWLRKQVPEIELRNGSPDQLLVVQAYQSLDLLAADGHLLARFVFSQTDSGHTLVRGEAVDIPHVATLFEGLWSSMRATFTGQWTTNGRSTTKGYGPNAATLTKLERLHLLRRQSIYQNHVTISWTAACQQIGIDPKTVRQYDPELRAHWDDPTYR